MKKLVAILFLFSLVNIFPQTNISPQFSELNRVEDKLGKNNLLPSEVLNLYPLAIGNRWINLYRSVINPNIWNDVKLTEVMKDSIASNGRLYFCLREDENYYLERVDSMRGKVYRYYQHPNLIENEYIVADLIGEIGDTIITFDPYDPYSQSYLMITGVDTFYKWGLAKFRKHYLQTVTQLYRNFSYTQDIGMDSRFTGIPIYSTWSERILKGCIINGIVYGDTTLTGIDDEENPIASEFKLEQNYPNPFNPSTKIKFTIPSNVNREMSNVTLKVYDILGNEIATLVNEELAAGEYEITFDSHSGEIRNLTSGIYFYQIKGDSFIQTKKMNYLK